MNSERWLDAALDELAGEDRLREIRAYPECGPRISDGGRPMISFSSNDYLGLARHPEVVAAAERALQQYGAGSAASRLVTGTLPIHEELERRLAAFKGYETALLFGSGFLANAGSIPALVGRSDTVIADRLAHASLVDAAVLSRARLLRFRHNDAGHLDDLLRAAPRRAKTLVLTESVFSMDGDLAPLTEIARVCGARDAMLFVDEAHATGVFGPAGSGLIRQEGLEAGVNLSMGTLSKALGGYGGFVACSDAMRRLLVNRARAFIYSTAPPPAVVGAALGALDVLGKAPGLGAELLSRAARFRHRLQQAGLTVPSSASQIVPVVVGENRKALDFSRALAAKGVLAIAIRPPTVPEGTARLRFSVSLGHSAADIEQAAAIIIEAAQEMNLI